MSALDYVLVDSWVDTDVGVYRFDQFLSNGEVRQLRQRSDSLNELECSGFRGRNGSATDTTMIPSPGGLVLAYAYLELSCDGRSLAVEFIDAESSGTVDGPNVYPLPENTQNRWEDGDTHLFSVYMYSAWTPENTFMVGFEELIPITESESGLPELQGNTKGWFFEAGAEPVAFTGMAPECFSPSTTSAYENALGQRISSQGGLLTVGAASAEPEVFGCGQ